MQRLKKFYLGKPLLPTVFTTKDRILTLSTCVGGSPEERFLVHAKLMWEGSESELEEAQRKIEEGILESQAAENTVPEATTEG